MPDTLLTPRSLSIVNYLLNFLSLPIMEGPPPFWLYFCRHSEGRYQSHV